MARGNDCLGLAEVTEHGRRFRTGLPVSFPYVHNLEKAPKTRGYQQELEPAGFYCLHINLS